MKFKKVTPKEPWSVEQTSQRIELVRSEIKTFNVEMNAIDSRVTDLLDRKKHLKTKVSNKQKYINQLEAQLLNIEQGVQVSDTTGDASNSTAG